MRSANESPRPARPGRSRHRPGRRDAPIRPAIAAMTAITPTIATARNRAGPLLPPPDGVGNTTPSHGWSATADGARAEVGGSVLGGATWTCRPCLAAAAVPAGRRSRSSCRALRTRGRSSRRGRRTRCRAAWSGATISRVWLVWLVHVTGSPTTTVSSSGTSPASVIAISCSSARTTAGAATRNRVATTSETMPATRPRTEHASPPPRTRAHRAECSVGIRGRDRPPYP